MFRRFLKKSILAKSTYTKIRKLKLAQKANLIVESLQLPQELLNKNQTKMACLILFNSHNLVSDRKLQDKHRRLFKEG